MAIQFVTDQFKDAAVTNAKLANSSATIAGNSLSLGGALAAGTLAGSLALDDIGVPDASVNLNSQKITALATPTDNSDAANKSYVDGKVAEITLTAGNGIAIDTSASPDSISVDLQANAGLSFQGASSDKLGIALKAESGGSISADASGLFIDDSAISNAKLANSTISGIALGSNLGSLSAGNGISMTSYNGSSAVSDLTVALDGSTLSKSASGVKISDGGVDTEQLANDSVKFSKLGILPDTEQFTGNGSLTSFNLTERIEVSQLNDFKAMVRAFRNGQRMRQVASDPADASEYTVTDSGSATVITMGGAPAAGEIVLVDYWYNAT
jgi:hypothetical protein